MKSFLETELQLTLAGLGRRSLTITENMTHSEVRSIVLVNAYPKLAKMCGGWLLHKCSGGGGQRKLIVIPPDPDGYNGQQLKTVSSNGKCTMYVVLLQEQTDTTPLPPDAREFEKMPKAQCTLCSQMIPLQCLPIHIKHCKMEHVDLCASSDDTAECPLCKKTFNSDVIEIHAANCGLRSGEILNWISSNVDQNNTFSICVSRNDIFNRGMQQWQRQKKSSPKGRLKVTFFGEAGVDSGALSKEFLTEMIAEIETRLFIDGVDNKGKNPVYCLNSLDRNYFRSAGEIMAVSLAQGGPPPVFLREWCFQYLCSGDYDSIQVTTSDVTDLEFSLLIEKVNSTDDISEFTDEILSCGYTGKVSADMKINIIRAIVLHSTMRVVPMLDQLRKGLQLFDLPKVMEMHPDLGLPLFVPGGKDDRVDAAFILENCHPVFSDKGSVKYTKEVNVMNFFQDFLQEVEDCGEAEQMTAGKVMQWMTGQRHKPILPSDQKDFNITVKFNHDCDTNHTVCFYFCLCAELQNMITSACSSGSARRKKGRKVD
uniref:HECT domain-containing protein n=1 Tax=Sinocyclocheilus grahami TaxID=75366 RepID=A0A672K884_SINGR